MSLRYYVAPVHFDVEVRYRQAGLSSLLNCADPVGARYFYPTPIPVQIDPPDRPLPRSWKRRLVAVRPSEDLAPGEICATLTLGTQPPDRVLFVVDAKGAPADWERMSLVVVDPKFFAEYGNSYIAPDQGFLYEVSYRVLVGVPPEIAVPGTWQALSDLPEIEAELPGLIGVDLRTLAQLLTLVSEADVAKRTPGVARDLRKVHAKAIARLKAVEERIARLRALSISLAPELLAPFGKVSALIEQHEQSKTDQAAKLAWTLAASAESQLHAVLRQAERPIRQRINLHVQQALDRGDHARAAALASTLDQRG